VIEVASHGAGPDVSLEYGYRTILLDKHTVDRGKNQTRKVNAFEATRFAQAAYFSLGRAGIGRH
jgi:hypothetical protein